jgi:hypothetical protein
MQQVFCASNPCHHSLSKTPGLGVRVCFAIYPFRCTSAVCNVPDEASPGIRLKYRISGYERGKIQIYTSFENNVFPEVFKEFDFNYTTIDEDFEIVRDRPWFRRLIRCYVTIVFHNGQRFLSNLSIQLPACQRFIEAHKDIHDLRDWVDALVDRYRMSNLDTTQPQAYAEFLGLQRDVRSHIAVLGSISDDSGVESFIENTKKCKESWHTLKNGSP